jgi:hypothetical protein
MFNDIFLFITLGLNKRARLLLASCRGAQVCIKRLRRGEIDKWTRPRPKIPQPLFQPWIQRSIANLPPDCTISLAPFSSSGVLLSPKQGVSPKLMVSRPESAKHFVKQQPIARSPPILVPLITSTWSLQGANNSFGSPLQPASESIAKESPFKLESKPKVTLSRSLPPTSISCDSGVIDLCSSEDDEEPTEEEKAAVGAMLAKPLFLPPGVTITKIERKTIEVNPRPISSLNLSRHERNNNRPRGISIQLVESASTLRSPPPALKFMGQHHRAVDKNETRGVVPFPALTSNSIHSIAPFKHGKLPIEKREQMKQSLLKIQQKEAKTLPSNTDNCCVTTDNSSFPTTDIPSLVHPPACGEERQFRVGRFLFSGERLFARKRTKDMESIGVRGELISPQEPFRKVPKLDPPTIRRERATIRDDSPTVIEVDVALHDRENRGDSPGSSFGSVTPDSRNGKRSRELSSLLNDECKELKQMGLEDMPLFDQRVTRCRTKSLPMIANRR